MRKAQNLPEVRSRQVLPAESPSFARVHQMLPSAKPDGQYDLGAYTFAGAQIVCNGRFDGNWQGRIFCRAEWLALVLGRSRSRVLALSACREGKFESLHERLPKVHIIINNFKSIPAGIFHGISLCYIQKYINEFDIRFHGRFRESQLPERLLQATVDYGQIRTPLTCLEAWILLCISIGIRNTQTSPSTTSWFFQLFRLG